MILSGEARRDVVNLPSGRAPILLLCHELTLGGTEGQFVEIACRLDRSRWDPHVSCVRAEGPQRARLGAAGVQAWSCGKGSFKSTRFAVAVVKLARFLRAHRVRLVHCFEFYSNLLGVPAARLARVPVVIASQRDLGNLRPPEQRRLHNLALRLADYVVVNTRIVVIPNGVDCTRFSPSQGEDHPPGRVMIGAVAMLRPEKGLVDLVLAAA